MVDCVLYFVFVCLCVGVCVFYDHMCFSVLCVFNMCLVCVMHIVVLYVCDVSCVCEILFRFL